MYIILAIGSILAIINVVLTYNELLPFFKAVKQLNDYTNNNGVKDKLLYPFRFVTLIPKLFPLALDATIAIVCGMIGMGGGVFGALIGITMGFTASLLVKFNRKFVMSRIKTNQGTWRVV
jgi:hypothetical protein